MSVASSEGKAGLRSVEHVAVAVEEEDIVGALPQLEGRMAAAAADKAPDLHGLGSFEGFEAGTVPRAEEAVLRHRAG